MAEETVEVSKEALTVLYGNFDGKFSENQDVLNEVRAVLDAAESDRFSIEIE